MNKYLCEICGLEHKLVTLIQFPQPKIISEITSGRNASSLEMLSKDIILVNREIIYFEVELKLNILDYEDELEMLIWCSAKMKDIKKQFPIQESQEFFVLSANLVDEIPFYTNSLEQSIEVKANLKGSLKPEVIGISEETKFKSDFIKGITIKELGKYLSKYYHFE